MTDSENNKIAKEENVSPSKDSTQSIDDLRINAYNYEAIIANARAGDNQSFTDIAVRYRPLIESIIDTYQIPKFERDDLLQESYIGLLKAVRTYDNRKGSSFSTYIYICVRNSVLSALNKYHRETKNLIFSDYIPPVVFDSPESMLLSKESTLELYNRFLIELSDYEKEVFELYLSENTAAQIAILIGRDEKSVSNAITRIKIKLRHITTE